MGSVFLVCGMALVMVLCFVLIVAATIEHELKRMARARSKSKY